MNRTHDEIVNLLKSSKANDRELGLWYVGKYWCYDLIQPCITALKDSSRDVRASAAWALDQLCNPEALSALLDALYDADITVRSNAGWALVHLARRTIPQMVVPEVIDILQQTHNQDARHMAYLVLYHIGDQTARDAISMYWDE